METNSDTTKLLLGKIRDKRDEIRGFIKKAAPRNIRLINIAIISSAVAAAMTAGPALGGKPFSGWLTETLGLTSPIWQLLCLIAMFSSIAAAIATNMSKSHEVASRLLRAQTCSAKLEGLETLLEIQQIDIEKASSLYSQYLTEVPFISTA